jgi:outer membrane lipoprotein-sorting protein
MGVRKAMTTRLLTAVLLTLWSGSAAAQTADEIVEKHLAALGGREALGRLRSRVSTGTVTLTTAVGPVSGTIEASAKVPNRSRVLIKLDLSALGGAEITNDQRFDGTTGYIIDSFNGNRDITGPQLESMRNNAFPTSWLDYRARGFAIALIRTEPYAGRSAFVLDVTPKTGPVTRVWIDTDTYMLLQTAAKAEAPGLGEVEQLTEYSDYRTVDGVRVPFQVKSINPAQTVTAVLKDVRHNVELDDESFKKP